MKLGDFIKSTFSTLINKSCGIFKALLSDDGNGTMEMLLSDAERCRAEWCNDTDFYKMSGERLEKCAALFSVLKRIYEEDDESFKKRMGLLLHRNGDTVWGDNWNILNVLRSYFDSENVWICNSTDDSTHNLIADPDFERMTVWALSGDVNYSVDAKFSGAVGVSFAGTGSCSQTVPLSHDTTYFLHFFLSGSINIVIQDNLGRYYNTLSGDFGAWQQERCVNSFSSERWDANRLFFITDANVENVNIIFEFATGNAFLDYVRLYAMDGSSTFSIIVQNSGVTTEETLVLAPGESDQMKAPVLEFAGFFAGSQDVEVSSENLDGYVFVEVDTWCMTDDKNNNLITLDYDLMSYYDNSFVYGAAGIKAQTVHEELIKIMAAGGTIPFVELILKDEDY